MIFRKYFQTGPSLLVYPIMCILKLAGSVIKLPIFALCINFLKF